MTFHHTPYRWLTSNLSFKLFLILVMFCNVTTFNIAYSKNEIVNSQLSKSNISINKIPSLDKLPLSAIHRIFQDKEGFMWYGTFDGLCRFDGYDVKIFRSDFHNPDLFKSNYVTFITEFDYKIWIGTTVGAYILDKTDYSISPINLGKDTDKNIFTISIVDDDTVWISVPGTLYELNRYGELKAAYPTLNSDNLHCAYFVTRLKDNQLITSLDGSTMFEVDTVTKSLKPYLPNTQIINIERILYDSHHDCYWLGTWGEGIVKFNPKASSEDQVFILQSETTDIGFNYFHMVQDNEFGYLWATSENDLNAFKITEDGNLKKINLSHLLPEGSKRFYEIYKDNEGSLWISSFKTPSFVIDFNKSPITFDDIKELRANYKTTPLFESLVITDDSTLWFGQEADRLFARTKEGGLISVNNQMLAKGLWKVIKLLQDRPNNVWAVTVDHNIHKLYLQNNKIEISHTINLNTIDEKINIINQILLDNLRQIWIATDKGLFVAPTYTDTPEIFEGIKDVVNDLAIANDGSIWVATDTDKLYRVNPQSHSSKSYDLKLISQRKIAVTSDGIIWIATKGGELVSFDPRTETSCNVTETLGLNGENINDLLIDHLNHLWIISHQFVKEFNPRNGAYRTYTTTHPEINLDRFVENAACISLDNTIIIGGSGGFIEFTPSQTLESMPKNVTVFITDLLIEGNSKLGEGLITTPEKTSIRLSPAEDNIEIHFSSLHYKNQEQIRYAYRLKGTDHDWRFTDIKTNRATYSHLRPGKHIFEVKATDDKGLWSDKIATLEIYRQPRFIETIWAKVIITLLICGLLCFIWLYLIRMRRQRELRHQLKELLEERTQYSNKSPIPDQTSVHPIPSLGASKDSQFIQTALKVIEENMGDEKFDVMTMASEMGMSKATLSRRLKSATGQSPAEFVREVRMRHAAAILKDPSVLVAEVADAVGYSDQRHFASLFKSTHGMTPSQYQNQFKPKTTLKDNEEI